MNDNFRLAVAHVAETFRDRVANGKITTFPAEPSEFLYRYGLRIVQEFDGKMTKYTYPEGAAEWLCMKADTDKGAFDLVCSIVASKLFRDDCLSEPLRVFAGLRVVGINLAPKGAKVAKTVGVNLLLLLSARRVSEDFELSLTRSDASWTCTGFVPVRCSC